MPSANRSTWDPTGKADSSEWTGTPGDCSGIVRKYNITGPTKYTYTAQGTSNCASGSAALDGGSGNPVDSGGHYGWNVEILERSASGARVRIWNEVGR